ncbi:MAG: hypothetical protein M3Z32_00770 [Acidobacteriota bacterium]|nr:hypothetical protein [Acidobacteriota bacterium]
MDDETAATDVGQTNGPDDLTTEYANNTAFEATVWDLKLIFGEFSARSKGIEWHTSITIPWALAKLIIYYLQVNIDIHELDHGKIAIPASMIPDAPPPIQDDGTAQAIFEIVQRNRERLMESLK